VTRRFGFRFGVGVVVLKFEFWRMDGWAAVFLRQVNLVSGDGVLRCACC
jgi:hypothetical protein